MISPVTVFGQAGPARLHYVDEWPDADSTPDFTNDP
jgi:hypothetical protein